MPLLPRPSFLGPVLQTLLVAVALLGATLAPPARGAMIAVPLTGGTPADAVDAALGGGGTVEGRGIVSGWIVVRGERARLSAPMHAHGFILLAAAPRLCA